jgi:hypothetical protein
MAMQLPFVDHFAQRRRVQQPAEFARGRSFSAGKTSVATYELGRSKISKLWVQRLADKQTVFNWDRGMDQPAATDLAKAIVDFLAAGLADLIYAA